MIQLCFALLLVRCCIPPRAVEGATSLTLSRALTLLCPILEGSPCQVVHISLRRKCSITAGLKLHRCHESIVIVKLKEEGRGPANPNLPTSARYRPVLARSSTNSHLASIWTPYSPHAPIIPLNKSGSSEYRCGVSTLYVFPGFPAPWLTAADSFCIVAYSKPKPDRLNLKLHILIWLGLHVSLYLPSSYRLDAGT